MTHKLIDYPTLVHGRTGHLEKPMEYNVCYFTVHGRTGHLENIQLVLAGLRTVHGRTGHLEN